MVKSGQRYRRRGFEYFLELFKHYFMRQEKCWSKVVKTHDRSQVGVYEDVAVVGDDEGVSVDAELFKN